MVLLLQVASILTSPDGRSFYGFREVNTGAINPEYPVVSGYVTASSEIESTPVPFDIPYGTTIPGLGSVLALGVMRKVRNFTSATEKFN